MNCMSRQVDIYQLPVSRVGKLVAAGRWCAMSVTGMCHQRLATFTLKTSGLTTKAAHVVISVFTTRVLLALIYIDGVYQGDQGRGSGSPL